jgi:hypothetical protein
MGVAGTSRKYERASMPEMPPERPPFDWSEEGS